MARQFLRVCVLIGVIALLHFFSWWFIHGVPYSPWVLLIFPAAVVYGVVIKLAHLLAGAATIRRQLWRGGRAVDR